MNKRSRQSGVAEGTGASARKSRLLKIGLLCYAALVLGLGWGFGIREIRSDRELTLQASNDQLIMTATALAKHVEAMIYDGVGAATAGTREIQALNAKHAMTPNDMSAVLLRMLTGGEYVNTLFIVTPSMYVSARRGGSVTFAQPEWTHELLAAKVDTWVGKPMNTAAGDMNVLIPIAKRVASINGDEAWAGALFSVVTLDAMYRSLPVQHSSVSLVTEDGWLIDRIPIVPGQRVAGMDVRNVVAHQRYDALPRQVLTTLQAPDPFTGKLRQYAARRIEGYPLVAVSGRNVEDSLIAWRSRTSASLWMFSIASMIFTTLTIVLYATVQRRFRALQRSEQRFQLAIAGTNDGIWEWEIADNRIYYSARYRQLLGYADEDEFPSVPTVFWQRLHPDDVGPTELALQRQLLHGDPYDVEFRLQVRSGDYRWFRSRGKALLDEHGKAFRMAGSISDIHDRKLAEQALEVAQQTELQAREEFAQHLLEAQEQERQRLANELHDSVGQNLSLIKNRALMLLHQKDLPPQAAQHAASLEQLAADVISEVRTVAQNLRPLHIKELGLTGSLEALLCKIGESGAVNIDKRLENVDDVIHGDTATHMYRIVQEALNNIIKHSQATACRVVLERDIHCVRLVITDNGKGFDAARKRHDGLGLSSMAERCRMIKATWKLDSAVGDGTRIQVELPVAEAAPAVDAPDAESLES